MAESLQESLAEPLLASSTRAFVKEETVETAEETTNHSGSDVGEGPPPEEEEEDEYILITDNESHYELDPKRFVVLALFSLNNLLPSAFWITFAPIEDAVQTKFHGITAQQVNWLSMIFMALYGPFTALCAWSIRRFGLRQTVVWNSVIMAVGSLLRWWSCYWISTDDSQNDNSHFAYVVLLTGQGIVAAGQPVFSNAPARVAASWFQQTTQAIGVTSLAALIGMVLGQAMSPLLVEESTGAHLEQLLMGQALCMVLCAVATWWWFDEQPAIPPTRAEAMRRRQPTALSSSLSTAANATTPPMTQDLWKLATDPQYIIIMIAFGVGYGVGNATLTLVQQWIASAGFPGDEVAGLCGSLSIAGGLLGTLIAAPWLDATKNYNQAVRVSFVVAFVVAVAAVSTMQPHSTVWLLAAAFTAMGMTQFPLLPICLDAAAAHSYPIPEELSSAGLQLGGQYLGIALVDVMGDLIENNPNKVAFRAPVNIMFLGLLGLSAAIALCYQGKDERATANQASATHNHQISLADSTGDDLETPP